MKRKNDGVEMFMCFVGVLLTGYFISAYDNIALEKNASQQFPFFPFSNLPWGADKAVDGRYSDRAASGGQCTISDSKKHNATWWVDLGRIFRIHHITIYYRTDNLAWNLSNGYTGRFLGFSVYVSNTTNKEEGVLCFKDTNYTTDTIPDNVTIECVKNGRYVIYINQRLPGVTYPEGYSQYAYNELCELEVFGCNMSGVYGENCTMPCPQKCIERHCNIIDGTCIGCIVGYKGSKCEDECDGWFYGKDCKISCGWCLNFEQCHHINGSCLKGCDIGFRGETCTQECPIGRYGYNCQETCSINCGVPGRCNRVNGQCQGGCQAGWKDARCDKKCHSGTFGQNCAQSCGFCLDKEKCHFVNGTCLNGCDRGYQEINCTQECPIGHYGYNCLDICSINCGVPGRCNRATGECQGGCQKEWEGSRCDKRCPFGVHGYRCNRTCSADCFNGTCDVMTGNCTLAGASGELEMINYTVQGASDQLETNNYFFIGGASAAIFFIVFVLVILIVVRRRNVKKRQKRLENTTAAEEFPTEVEKGNLAVYENIELNRGHLDMCYVTDISGKFENAEYQEINQIRKSQHYQPLC